MGLGWHRLCTGFRDEKSVAIREHHGVYNGRVTGTGIEAGRGYVIPSMRRRNYAQGYQSVMCRVIDEEWIVSAIVKFVGPHFHRVKESRLEMGGRVRI